MSCKLIVTTPAENDLAEIAKYISNDLSAPHAASDFLDQVLQCYDNLEKNPLMYALCDSHNLKEKEYRKAVIKNYVMLYRFDKGKNTVYILRFFYGRRDYINLI